MVLSWITTHEDLIGSVLTLIGSGLTIFISKEKHGRFVKAGGVITLAGGILTLVASQNSSISQAARQQLLVDGQKVILQNANTINAQVIDASAKLKDLQTNLGQEKRAVGQLTGFVNSGTKQLLSATKQVSDEVTGGTNFCFLRAYPDALYGGSSELARIQIINNGTLNCYDVSFEVSPQAFPTDDTVTMKQKFNTRFYGSAQIIHRNEMKHGMLVSGADSIREEYTNVALPPGSYSAEITERNGSYFEELVITHTSGLAWSVSMKVTRMMDNKVVLDRLE